MQASEIHNDSVLGAGWDVIAQAQMSSLVLSVLIVSMRLDWGTRDKREREVRVEAENERVRWGERKKCKIINVRATVTLHICTVTVAIVHKCTILHPLMWGFFWVKMYKMGNFFYFARVYTCWCGCSNVLEFRFYLLNFRSIWILLPKIWEYLNLNTPKL